MKYILSKKELDSIQTLVNNLSVNIDCIYVERLKMNKTGDIKYDTFLEYIKENIHQCQEYLNDLKCLTDL